MKVPHNQRFYMDEKLAFEAKIYPWLKANAGRKLLTWDVAICWTHNGKFLNMTGVRRIDIQEEQVAALFLLTFIDIIIPEAELK